MSSPQIQISGLPAASMVDDSDYTIVRQGLGDYKAEVGLIRAIDISAYPVINTPALGDLMMINRAGSNYSARFDRIGFVAGTVMWFYQDTAPSGWETIGSLGDSLLAVMGGTNRYQTFGSQGTWTQSAVPLTIEQIPAHSHTAPKTKDTTNASNRLGPLRGKTLDPGIFITNSTGGQGSTPETGIGGPCLPHSHGNTWRPLANVGILARKML